VVHAFNLYFKVMDLLHVSTNTVCATRVFVLQSLINGSVPSLSREAEVSRGGGMSYTAVRGSCCRFISEPGTAAAAAAAVVRRLRLSTSRLTTCSVGYQSLRVQAARTHARTHAACEISRVPRTHGRDAAARTKLADEASRLSPKRPGSSTCPPCPSDFCFRQRSRRRVQQLEKPQKVAF